MDGYILSASQITTYLACPRKFAFRYVERIPAESHSSALAFGSAVHATLEWYHLEKLEGRAPDPGDVGKLFRTDWEFEQEKPLAWKDGETPADLAAMGEELVRQYAERYRAIPIEAAEVPFDVPLVDPETGEVMPERLRGYFDLVLPDDQIVEIKTAARRFDRDTLRRKVQLSAYSLAYRTKHGRKPSLVVISLLKQKKPTIDVQVTTRTPADDAFFVHLAANVARGIDAGAFPPNPGWMCGDCEFAKACSRWRGDLSLDSATYELLRPNTSIPTAGPLPAQP